MSLCGPVINWRLVQGVTPPSAKHSSAWLQHPRKLCIAVQSSTVQGSGVMDNGWMEFIRRLQRHSVAGKHRRSESRNTSKCVRKDRMTSYKVLWCCSRRKGLPAAAVTTADQLSTSVSCSLFKLSCFFFFENTNMRWKLFQVSYCESLQCQCGASADQRF